MNATGPSIGSTIARYSHRALLYETREELITALAGFVTEGIEADEHVLVVVDPVKAALLVDRLGTSAGFVLADAADIYTSPTKTLAAFIATVRASTSDGRPMRVAGEPIWAGLSALEVAEWTCFESACNVAFAESALTMVCPYDISVLDPVIIDAARRTHPQVRHGDSTAVSATFTDPDEFHAAVRRTELMSPTSSVQQCSIVSPGDPWRTHDLIDAFADSHALPAPRTRDLTAAVDDVARTALAAGAPSLNVRLWLDDDRVICDISGTWTTVPFAGYIRHRSEVPGSPSLWSAGQVCDLFAVRERGTVTSIRLQVSGSPIQINPTCAEFADFLGVYALGACDPDENVMVESHLAECSTCREEATRLGAVVAIMLAELAVHDPPPLWPESRGDPTES